MVNTWPDVDEGNKAMMVDGGRVLECAALELYLLLLLRHGRHYDGFYYTFRTLW